ncbi:MAG: tail fiber protein [Pseudomonadota bacterium]
MSESFVGEIRIFAGNFPPRGWAFCQGQMLPISGNEVLYTLIGTTYGGDGQSTFALPDLRSRAPIHQGQGPGLSNYVLGQSGGVESVTLLNSQLPQHTHGLAYGGSGTQASPQSGLPSITPARDYRYSDAPANTSLHVNSMQIQGGSLPHENRSPYLALNFIICQEGPFPSRN